MDFVALKLLLDCPPERSSWMCGSDIRSTLTEFALGDPAGDQIVLDSVPFETIYDTTPPRMKPKLFALVAKYITNVVKTASLLSPDDTLCLVLCGHGSANESLCVGNPETWVPFDQESLEVAVQGCKGQIHLFTTACYSGGWMSPHWTLYAAARKDQEALSMVKSESGYYQGGFFTYALLVEHANQHSLKAPKPGCVEDDGNFTEQAAHDFGSPYTGQQVATPWLAKRTMSEATQWLHKLRDHIGRTYTSADFTFSPEETDKTWKPPFATLYKLQSIQHSFCHGPNPQTDSESDESDISSPMSTSTSHSSDPASDSSDPTSSDSSFDLSGPKEDAVLSKDDEDELLVLSKDHLSYAPPDTLSENFLADNCSTLLGRRIGKQPTNQEKFRILQALRERVRLRMLHLSIAQRLGWQEAITRVGQPFTEQRRLGSDFLLQQRAHSCGCLLFELHVINGYTSWVGGAGWLARVWEAAGEPTISPAEWKAALKKSCRAVGVLIEDCQVKFL
jgi:hypothetical protein